MVSRGGVSTANIIIVSIQGMGACVGLRKCRRMSGSAMSVSLGLAVSFVTFSVSVGLG